jgi:hypothetical protein
MCLTFAEFFHQMGLSSTNTWVTKVGNPLCQSLGGLI